MLSPAFAASSTSYTLSVGNSVSSIREQLKRKVILIAGYPDNTMKPKASATRAEAATVILRAVEMDGNGKR